MPPDHERDATQIQRFQLGERLLHWALALPFVLLYITGIAMLLFYNEEQPRYFRDTFSTLHRIAGVMLILFPPAALILGRADWRMHARNMREGWLWSLDDIRWLILFPLSVVDPRVVLPEQGKFNAAEKLNFMAVSAFYPLYIITGVLVWLPGEAFLSYIGHYTMAMLGVPLVIGHIFMATINEETKVGLSGMFTGWVDRGWAKHHYRRWYRENFEAAQESSEGLMPLLSRPARLRCAGCKAVHAVGSWAQLLKRTYRVEPLFCAACKSEIRIVGCRADSRVADAIGEHLRRGGVNEPFQWDPKP